MSKFGIEHIYRYYKKNNQDPVDYRTFVDAWKDFADAVTDDIAFTGKDFMMPFRVGTLGIRKRKIQVSINKDGTIDKRYLRPDWVATRKLWNIDPEAKKNKQLVFHLNKHFNGFNCKWFWDKTACLIPNQSAYSLVMTRENKRKLAKAIFNGESDYYEQKPKYYGRSN